MIEMVELTRNEMLFVTVIAAGLLLAGMFMLPSGEKDSVSADVVDNPDAIGQGSEPDSLPAVETKTPETEDAKLVETGKIGYAHTYYPIDNIPKVLQAPGDLSHNGFQDIYFTNLRRENGRFKFCVENRGNSFNGRIGAIHISVDHGTVLERFTHVVVPPGKKECFVTTDKNVAVKQLAESTNTVVLYLPHL